MALNPDISLSTASLIEDCIQHAAYEFSIVDTMGSMVNNAKFRAGYDDLAAGKKTEKSYIWEALSAVSEDLGQTLYNNVKNYINNVANVDTCKVRALKSMMSILGSDYKVLDKISYYPIEIQNLLDILSISKKYLLNNQYIKKDFLDACVADGIASCFTPQQMLSNSVPLSILSSESFLSIGTVSSSNDYYLLQSDDAFYAYLSGVYGNFIYDMLALRGTGICADVELYKTGFLSDVYGVNAQLSDKYLLDKRNLNVDVNFNVEQVVNDIDAGVDQIDNYYGDELSLLMKEIDWRKSPASGTLSMDLATRYIYYRKQKVVEYAEFVDNMVFLPVNFQNYIEYAYDKDYLTMLSNAQHQTCISCIDGQYQIRDDFVNYTAMSLAQITKYISKIRDTIRLQTRKVFMKGTNNLLRYTANEFVIDYVNSLKNALPFDKVSAFVEKLSAHSIDDVAVQEYWDLTEYMNLSTTTTPFAMNSYLANPRFFDDTFKRVNGRLIPESNNIFTNEQLNQFYIDKLGIGNALFPALSANGLASDLSSNFYEFLSVLFDVAASTAYYNDKQKFGMKLPNSVITEKIDSDLLSAITISAYVESCAMSADYVFDNNTSIGQQIDGLSKKLYDILQLSNHAGISSTYDTYDPVVQDISGQMNALTSDFNALVNDTYINYFGKSSSIYCYDQDGNYLFDYYVGDSQYSYYTDYETSAASVRDWINDGHCFSFALSTVIDSLSTAYDECYSYITAIIETDLRKLDYIDTNNADLGQQMDDMQDFVNNKITQRNTYLANTLQNLKEQASQAKQDHASIQNTFSAVLANLPNLPHQNFYMVGCDAQSGEGTHRLIDPIEKNRYLKKSIYDAVSQARYVESKEYGTYKKVDCGYLDELLQIDQTQPLESQIEQCISIFDQASHMSFGAGTTALHTTGTQKATLQTLQSGMTNITSSTIPSIVQQLKSLYNIDIDVVEAFTGKSCIQQIEYLMSYLNTEVSEQNFNGDAVIQKYYQILGQINEISNSQYIPAKSQYEAMWTDFNEFFADYPKGLDYQAFLPVNLSSANDFRQKKDNIALNQINEQLDSLDRRYDALVQQFAAMCTDNTIMLYGYDAKPYQYTFTGNALEYCIGDIVDKMLTDIEVRDILATEQSNDIIDTLQQYVELTQQLYRKYLPYAIDYTDIAEYSTNFNALTESFMNVVQEILHKLDYNDVYEYKYSKDLFQNYSGIPEIATDPYYNLKNQTHPSYQIHPFMWYFIEYHLEQTALDLVSKDIIGLSYDMLEAAKIASSIDSLLGKFGNILDVWKSNMLDFTGYTTKYEQSNHVCERTGRWSEVVGYEGAFYPPALSAYLKNVHSSVSNLDQYYKHLKLDADLSMKSVIDMAMLKSFNSISSIASLHDKSSMYDIYKYCVDSYGNMYMLYKCYNDAQPSEKMKLDTPGELWIRLADSPLAFPLSSIVDMDHSSEELPGRSSLHSMDNICDICMVDSGAKLVLTGHKTENEFTYTYSRPLYVEYDVKEGCGVGKLRLVSTDMHSNKPNEQTSPFPQIDKTRPPEWRYLGSLNRNAITIDVVYISYDAQLNCIPPDPVVKVFTVTTNEIHGFDVTTVSINGLSNVVDDFPVVSNHDAFDNNITSSFVDIMFAEDVSNDEHMFVSPYKDLSAGQLSAAAGYMFNDPLHSTMNSFDLMSSKLVMKSICVSPATAESTLQLQTNTDMGFIPSYAYDTYENVLDIKQDLDNSHQIVELLGKSKEIDSLASQVITDPDPYITKQKLFDKYMYGRIYEDDGMPKTPGDWLTVESFNDYNAEGDCSFDQSINIYSNWQMYPNMPNSYDKDFVFNYVDGHYQWNIRLDNRYTLERLRGLRLFIYSTLTLGKNPYVVAEMSDVIDACEKLAQNEFLSTNYDASHYEVTTYSFNDQNFSMQVVGTQNGIDQVDSYFSNALPNIIDFKYKYATLGGGMYLKLDFKLKDVNADGYLDDGVVRVALVDMFDLSFYNWYHFIDPGVTFGDYQRVLNRLSGDPLLKQDLLAIDFSNYSYLSDVQVHGMRIFDTNARIQFKINEEDTFYISSYNYYVPSLNLKYPLTFAQSFDTLYNIPEELLRHSVNVYEPDEQYVLEVTDAELLSSLNSLQMLYNDFPDDYRVYEDYFHIGDDGLANNNRFCSSDPLFYQYAHIINDETGVGLNDISIDQSACVDVRIDGTDIFSIRMSNLSLDVKHSERGESDTAFGRPFNFKDLGKDIKSRIIQHVKKFMRLHFSYAKTKDNNGIVIYVNYQNYINSPYVKLVDGLPYLDLIPGTYLKLYPGESGLVNVVVQFRQYLNDVLMGINNITIAAFKIYNVSDDKPKFIIERQNQIR